MYASRRDGAYIMHHPALSGEYDLSTRGICLTYIGSHLKTDHNHIGGLLRMYASRRYVTYIMYHPAVSGDMTCVLEGSALIILVLI